MKKYNATLGGCVENKSWGCGHSGCWTGTFSGEIPLLRMYSTSCPGTSASTALARASGVAWRGGEGIVSCLACPLWSGHETHASAESGNETCASAESGNETRGKYRQLSM